MRFNLVIIYPFTFLNQSNLKCPSYVMKFDKSNDILNRENYTFGPLIVPKLQM